MINSVSEKYLEFKGKWNRPKMSIKGIYLWHLMYVLSVFTEWVALMRVSYLGYSRIEESLDGKVIIVGSSVNELISGLGVLFNVFIRIVFPLLLIVMVVSFTIRSEKNGYIGSVANLIKDIGGKYFSLLKSMLLIWLKIGVLLYLVTMLVSPVVGFEIPLSMYLLLLSKVLVKYMERNREKNIRGIGSPIFESVISGESTTDLVNLVIKEKIQSDFNDGTDMLSKEVFTFKVKYVRKLVVYEREKSLE